MKRWLALAILLLPAYARAQIVFDPPSVDLGAVKSGQVFERAIKVKNAGVAPVTVTELKASCGCLAPRLEPMTLAPGQNGTLFLQINTLSNTPGPQGWRVSLVGTDAEFIVRAELTQEIVISPASLTLYGGRRATQHSLQITDRRAKPLRVLKAETSSPLLEAAGPSPTGELKLTVKEGFADGRHDERVTLLTDDAEYPRLIIPVTVVKKPTARFTATPPLAQFSREGSEPTPSKQVTVRDARGEAMKVERLEADHPALTAEVVKQDGGFVTLKVTLDRRKAKDAPQVARVWLQIAGQPAPISVPVQID